MKSRSLLAILIVAMFVSTATVAVVTFTDDDSVAASNITKVNVDAAGNDITNVVKEGGTITVGSGALRWVSYVGMMYDVKCIDYGDINAASQNGKGYRALFDLDNVNKVNSAEIVKKYGSEPNNPPLESDLKDFGMAIHSHNNFTTADLEELGKWSNVPKTMVVIKPIYDKFTPELKSGITNLGIKFVVIRDCLNFMNDDLTLHDDFLMNLAIMGTTFGKIDTINELVDQINMHVGAIKGMIKGKTPKFDSAYIGAASNAGGKSLTWTVGDYLPFKLAGVKNAYAKGTTVSEDAGSEVMSKTTPEVIFMDLSSTTKFVGSDPGSNAVLKYAELKNVPIYTILPYFWFGYNFDNAIANAYYLVYVCYDGILSFDDVVKKVGSVYGAFYPELKKEKMDIGGKTYSDGDIIMPYMMTKFYSAKGTKLTLDGNCLKVTVGEGKNTFEITERPKGNANSSGSGDDNSMIIISVTVVAIIAIGLLGYALFKRR